MNPQDLLSEVIRPTLITLDMHSEEAEQIVLGTAIAESNLEYLKQIGGGPGSGLWQPEPFTARDVLRRYLNRKSALRAKFIKAVYVLGDMRWSNKWTDDELSHGLKVNMALGAAVCRLIYWWIPNPIPTTLEGQAQYHVDYYNKGGAATVDKYVKAWRHALEL